MGENKSGHDTFKDNAEDEDKKNGKHSHTQLSDIPVAISCAVGRGQAFSQEVAWTHWESTLAPQSV